MPWPQFPGQPPFQMHSIIPTETLRSDNAHVPMAIQKTWSLYLHMAYGLIRRKKWLNSVEPGYYHRPAKTASTERRTQETIRSWEARPPFRCFYTILHYVYCWPFYWRSARRGEPEALLPVLASAFQVSEHQPPPSPAASACPENAGYFLVTLNSHFTLNLIHIDLRTGQGIVPTARKSREMRPLVPPFKELILWSRGKIFITPSQHKE